MPYPTTWTPLRSLHALALLTLVAGCGDGTTDPEEAAPRVTTLGVFGEVNTLKAIGQTMQVTAEVLDQWARPIVDVPVLWSSSAPLVVAVDQYGVVTAMGEGEAVIRAEAGGVGGGGGFAMAVVQEVASVVLSPAILAFSALGDTARLLATARDANRYAVAGATVGWSSSDPAVALVDDTGLVHAAGVGEAVIVAEADGVAEEAPLRVVQCADNSVVIPRIDNEPFYRYFNRKMPLVPDSNRIVLEARRGDTGLLTAVLVEAGVSVDTIRGLGGGVRLAELSPATSLADARAAVEVLREDVRLTFVSLEYRIPVFGSRWLPVNGLTVQFTDDATLEEIACLDHSARMTLEREREGGRYVWLTYPRGAEPLSVAEFYHLHPLTVWAAPAAVSSYSPPFSRGSSR